MVPQLQKRRKLDHPLEVANLEGSPEYLLGRNETQDLDENHSTLQKSTIGTKRAREPDTSALSAGETYNSSMFKLQVDEMLAEVKPSYTKRFGPVDKALRRLKSLIEDIKEREPLPVLEASHLMLKLHNITVPFPDPTPDKDAAYKLAYQRPSSINVVGSYPLRTMTKEETNLEVDMVVTMPLSLLQEKDFLNYRYFYKRAYYVACIAAGLEDLLDGELQISFGYLHGNSLQPILVVSSGSSSNDFSKSRCNIRIIPAAPEGFFSKTKLQPNKNAVRLKPLTQEETKLPSPTPFYNSTIQADCNYAAYLKLLHHASRQAEGFRNSCVLGRIWLRQRGFGSSLSKGGFGPFEWAALTALLLYGGGSSGHKVLSPGYSSYQLFKAMVQYISSTDLVRKPMYFQAEPFILCQQKASTPTFYDGPRGLNILFKMSPWSYDMLREEANISLAMLNDLAFDQFEATFILQKDQALLQFDSILKMPYVTIPPLGGKDHTDPNSILGLKIYDVLKEGLGDRVKVLRLKLPETRTWCLKDMPPNMSSDILAGFVFDPANIDRVVDHGPSAEEKKKAAKFRTFWGQKAELRRFKDGSILESLVWESTSEESIFREIVTYLLKRHIGSAFGESLSFTGEQFGNLNPGSETSLKAFSDLQELFSTFEKDIRNLEGLPLQLKQLSATGPGLRSSSLSQPIFSPREHLREPVSVVIQFEGSGRWPDDIVAIQRTKVAFLLKIGSLLQESVDGLSANLGLENTKFSLLNCAFLDVLYPSGSTFRLRIHNDREGILLDRQIKDKTIEAYARELAVSAMSLYNRTFIQLPLHTQSVATHCTRFPLLSSTIRLVKRWFESHMLSSHVREELVELLAIRTFLHPYPWRAPSSAMTGFLRTLHFISRWDWRTTPLIVDFTGTMTSKDIASINTRLEAWRGIDPGMNRTVLFAASNHDLSGISHTDGMPSRVVAARMTALARSACKLVKERSLDLEPSLLFAPSTSEYDFIIHLSPKFSGLQRGMKSTRTNQFKNLAVQSEEDLLMVGYEPVKSYLDEMKILFAASVVFFYDSHTSSFIAGLWTPQTARRTFKVNIPYNIKPPARSTEEDESEEHVDIDKSTILSEMARLGGDMVHRIVINS